MALVVVLCATVTSHAQSWYDLFYEAHVVSIQGKGTPEKIQRGQDSAIGLANRALQVLAASQPDNDSARCAILERMADFYTIRGDFDGAAKTLDRVSPYIEHHDGFDVVFELALHRVGLLCAEHPDVTINRDLRAAGVALRDTLLNQASPAGIPRLYRLAEFHGMLGHIDRFHTLMAEIIRIDEANSHPFPQYEIRALIFLAEGQSKPSISSVQKSSANQDSAVVLGERALALAKASYGTDDTLYAFAAVRLGDYYMRLGDDDRTVALWTAAWQVYGTRLPPAHIEYQSSLHRMSGVYRATGQYEKAERVLRELLRLRIQTQGAGHPEVAGMHEALASVLRLAGRFDEAKRHELIALDIRDHAIERVQSDVAQVRRRLGRIEYDRGDYVAAETDFLTAIDLEKTADPTNDRRMAQCLIDLAALYKDWNRPEEAEPMLTHALSLQEDFLRPDHPDIAQTLTLLAQIQVVQGRLADATVNVERAQNLLVKDSAYMVEDLANCHFLRAQIARVEAHYPDAIAQMSDGLRLLGRVYTPHDYRFIPHLAALAEDYAHAGNEDSLSATLERALALNRQLEHVEHPYSAELYESCARCYHRAGRDAEAFAYASRAFNIRRRNLIDGLMVMTERDALQTATLAQTSRDLAIGLAGIPENGVSVVDAGLADLMLRSKGIISQGLLYRHREQSRSPNPDVIQLRDSLSYAQATLSKLYTHSLRLFQQAAYTDVIQEQSDAVESLKKTLAHMPGEQPPDLFTDFSYHDIAAALPKQSVLVDYLRCHIGDTDRYFALVVRPTGTINCADLGTAAAIDSAVALYQNHFAQLTASDQPPGATDLAAYRRIVRNLQALVWDPIDQLIGEAPMIFVSADGQLNVIAWSGFVIDDDHYLIEKHAIHYLASAQDLLRPHSHPVKGHGLLAIGDPDFRANVAARIAASAPSDDLVSLTPGERPGSFHSALIRSDCFRASLRSLPRLRGTRIEVNRIATLWSAERAEPVREIIGAAASEEAVKRLSTGYRVLHFATHSHFPLRDCRTTADDSRGIDGTPAVDNTSLLLSGLCLAGVADPEAGAPRDAAEDGLLTAEEIAGLDLDGTDLVVLSACETGLGSIRTNEGVDGLRRAFQMAGARTVISSLWRIADDATITLMEHLYQHIDQPVAEALRSAELSALNNLRRHRRIDHPYYWGGFVSTGDWR